MDVKVVAIRQFAHLCVSPSHRQDASGRFFPPQRYVLSHREYVDEHEVLVNHSNTGRHGLLGIIEVLLHPVDVDLPFIGRQQAVQNVHQG